MANNEEILNELFFKKKKSYSESLKDKQAQYKPVSKTADIKSLFNGNSVDGFVVSDTDEVKKRIVGALGMAMGNNTIKSMAHKAIKSFPIIVSDDVAPETLVMIKTMMEEQYASYIDLLVSNQIINLTDYEVGGENGNIAIQALNKIDGTDFGTSRIARQARTGSLSIDDIMKNNPGWAFIRANEGLESGNAILDTLMENAIIIPSEYTNDIVGTMLDETYLTEATGGSSYIGSLKLSGKAFNDIADTEIENGINVYGKKPAGTTYSFEDGDQFYDVINKRIYVRYAGKWNEYDRDAKPEKADDPIRKIDLALNDIRMNNAKDSYRDYGFDIKKNTEGDWTSRYDKLITPNALVDKRDLNVSLDRSVAEILSGKNAKNGREKEMAMYVRDRFEKASYLLASARISGNEYICYLVDRLGIPVSDATRKDLLIKFPTSRVTFKGEKPWKPEKGGKSDGFKEIRSAIDKNERYLLNKTVPNILGISGKDVLIVTGGTLGGAGAGTIAAGTAVGLGATLAAPFIWIPLAGAAVGGGVAALVRYIINRRRTKEMSSSIEGWERVEALIDDMDYARNDLYAHMLQQNQHTALADEDELTKAFKEEDGKRYAEFTNKLGKVLSTVTVNENVTDLRGYMNSYNYSVEKMNAALATLEELDEALKADEEAYAETIMMNEGAKYIINTKKPGDIIVKQSKLKAKDFADAIPLFGTKDVVAYGSVEYDKRELKDRKYNEPLILTIKFKERYSDGKYSDNELTAVIGILGVITRVPSNEMAYILKENAEGKTLKNFFGSDSNNNSKDLIGNVISNFMGTKAAEKLPTSGKVWANLEKVSALAIANKLSGSNNGNISNAHLVFSQREIDAVKNEIGVDYLKNAKLTAQLMKKYSAFMIMVCNDALQYVYSYSDPDAISWDDAPYSAYMGKSNSDQLLSAFTQYNRMKL